MAITVPRLELTAPLKNWWLAQLDDGAVAFDYGRIASIELKKYAFIGNSGCVLTLEFSLDNGRTHICEKRLVVKEEKADSETYPQFLLRKAIEEMEEQK